MSRKREVKVWRCGNFVIRKRDVPTFDGDEWRLTDGQVRDRVNKGQMGTVEVIEVSSLDGAWGVRVMPGSQMESLMGAMLDDNEDVIDNEWMQLVCTNLITASSVPNGHYHMALMLVNSAYCDPSLISGNPLSKKRRAFARDVRKVRDAFVAWRKDYDEFIDSQPDDDERHEALRMAAEDVLDEPQELTQE